MKPSGVDTSVEYDIKKLTKGIRYYAGTDEDLIQVGWLTVLESIPDYDASSPKSFENWVLVRVKVAMARHRMQYRYAITHPKHNRPGITVPTTGATNSSYGMDSNEGEPLVELQGDPYARDLESQLDAKADWEKLTEVQVENLLSKADKVSPAGFVDVYEMVANGKEEPKAKPKKLAKTNKSGHKGIAWLPSRNRWLVFRRKVHLGSFKTLEEAVTFNQICKGKKLKVDLTERPNPEPNPNPRKRPTSEEREEIRRLRKEGMKLKEIAAKMDRSLTTIKKILRPKAR